MWSSCFTLIGKNGHIPTFGYNRCKVQQISTQKSFSKNFVAIGKNFDSGAHILWGESIARGDEYGKKQSL